LVEPTAELLEIRQFSSEQEIITYHLKQVEKHLTKKNTKHLTKEVQQCRQEGLEVLRSYWQRGLYPKNNHFNYRIPFFIDDANTACAVGYIMQGTGNEALADYIAETQNNAYVKQMAGDNIFEWANNYGFTVDELAWIQPAYGPCWNNGNPSQGNIVNPTCGNSDGSFEVFANEIITYEWAHGATGLQLDNLPAGVYTLTGTYNEICPFELNIVLENENGADLTVNTLNHQTCNGIEDGVAEVEVSNANGSYDIEWSNGATGTVASNLTQGYNFVTVTDAMNCKAIERYYINMAYLMYSYPFASGSLCNDNTGQVDLNVNGGAGNDVYTYQWSDGNNAELRTNMAAGDYSVIISDDAGCFIEQNVTIYDDCEGRITCTDDFADVNSQNSTYIFPFANDMDPTEAEIIIVDISKPASGYINITYFDPYNSFLLNEYKSFTYTPDGGYTGPDSFTYSFCTNYGFCDSATVYLNVVAEPVVQVINYEAEDMVICEGESIQLLAAGAETYSWSPTTGLDEISGGYVNASPSQTTIYTVTGTTADGQTDTHDITIEVGADINPVITSLPPYVNIGQGGIPLSANPAGGVFSGNGVAFDIFNPVLTLSGLHDVTYTYTDENTGCISQTTQSVLVFSVSFNFVNYNLGTIDPKWSK